MVQPLSLFLSSFDQFQTYVLLDQRSRNVCQANLIGQDEFLSYKTSSRAKSFQQVNVRIVESLSKVKFYHATITDKIQSTISAAVE